MLKHAHLRAALAALLLILALSTAALAQGEPEIIIINIGPANNHFANATPLVLNSSVKTSGLLSMAGTEATEESDPDLTACEMARTVWWKFTAPFDGTIALTTAGSQIVVDDNLIQWSNTMIAVYTGTTLANLTQVSPCGSNESGYLGEIDNLDISTGTTYYVRVGTPVSYGPTVNSGFFQLTTMVREANGYDPVNLINGDFAFGLDTLFAGWNVKNATNGDAIVAGGFKFFGGVGEKTKLIQKRNWPVDTLLARPNHALTLIAKVNSDAGANFKVAVMVTYSDGTPPSKGIVKVIDDQFQFVQATAYFSSPNVKAVKVIFLNKATSGQVVLDDIWLDYEGSLLRGESEPAPLALPLP